MKLVYFEKGRCWNNDLFKYCKELCVDVWRIVPYPYHENDELMDNDIGIPTIVAKPELDVAHLKDTVKEIGDGIFSITTAGVPGFSYENYKSKVLDLIKDHDAVYILLSPDELFSNEADYCYSEYANTLSWLVEKSNNVFLFLVVDQNIHSDDYHELLKFYNIDYKLNIKAICIININLLVPEGVSPNIVVTEAILQAVRKTKSSFFADGFDTGYFGDDEEETIVIEESEDAFELSGGEYTYLYNHAKGEYCKYIYQQDDFPDRNYHNPDILLEIAPNDGKAMCNYLKNLRRNYARIYEIEYSPEICSYEGVCLGTCQKCDNEAKYLYQNSSYSSRFEIKSSIRSISANIRGISRLRKDVDGKGIRTLILFDDCDLACKYCINKKNIKQFLTRRNLTVEQLCDYTDMDRVYFKFGGGVTFGGGEPLLNADFIVAYHAINLEINIAIETSLNEDLVNVKKLVPFVDEWIIDVKDMNPKIYWNYAGKTNTWVIHNLKALIRICDVSKIRIRLPYIPGYNTEKDINDSEKRLRKIGFTNIERFTYQII